MSLVLFITPYPEMADVARDLAGEMNFPLKIIESALDEAVEMIRGLVKSDSDTILIVRGATADLAARDFPNTRLVRVDPTEIDMAEALVEARKRGERIGFLGPATPEMKEKVQRLSAILGLEVHGFWYTNSVEFARQIELARSTGIQVMVGGGQRGELMCNQRGIEHIKLLSGRETIRQALVRAKDIVDTQEKERDNAAFVRMVVEHINEGIIAVDEHQVVTLFNPTAAALFQMAPGEVIGRSLSDLSFRRSLTALFEGGVPEIGEIHDILGGKILVNRVRYTYGGKKKGILVNFQDVTRIQESEQKIRRKLFSNRFTARSTFDDIVHCSAVMEKVLGDARRFSSTDCNVLILGESGTGKELMAQSMHNGHPGRRKGPFVAINCAALSESLLESELFGYEPGAFTGAQREGKAGVFELAHGGTLFLDEVGKVSPSMQAKLLRVLQEREVRRIGGERIVPVDVRVIAAANEDLHDLMEKGSFREDLYYRLSVLVLRIPPLRERSEDIPGLVNFVLQKLSVKYGGYQRLLPEPVLRRICELHWPGNVRQLENVLERCFIMTNEYQDLGQEMLQILDQEYRTKSDVKMEQNYSRHLEGKRDESPLLESSLLVPIDCLEAMERNIVWQLQGRKGMTKKELARRLGVSRTTLWKLLNKSAVGS